MWVNSQKALQYCQIRESCFFCTSLGLQIWRVYHQGCFLKVDKADPGQTTHPSRHCSTSASVVSALRQFPRQHAALLCFGSSILSLLCLGVFTISSSAASSPAKITLDLCTEKMLQLKFCSGSGVFFGTRCPILYVLHIYDIVRISNILYNSFVSQS